MGWSVDYNHKLQCIEITYFDMVTSKEVSEATTKSLTYTKRDVPNLFLCDVTEADIKLSMTDLFDLPDAWDAKGLRRVNKMAIIMAEESQQRNNLSFFEDVSVNRGWNVKLFTGRETAIDWLVN